MKLRIPLPVLAVSITLAALAIQSSAAPSTAGPSLDERELTLLQLINDYRQENGSSALVPSAQLNAAADWFANDMASKNYFPSNHEDSLGRSPGERGADFGYPWGVGENSGAGGFFSDPQEIFDAWRGSSGHNSNMLGSLYSMVGIGVAANSQSTYGWYWVLDLGTVLTEPAPAPTPTPAPTPAGTPPPNASPAPTPSPSPSTTPPQTPNAIHGDANCDFSVGSLDALIILKKQAGYDVDSECLEHGNVDCDDDVDTLDALAILRWVVSQPISTNENCSPIGVPV